MSPDRSRRFGGVVEGPAVMHVTRPEPSLRRRSGGTCIFPLTDLATLSCPCSWTGRSRRIRALKLVGWLFLQRPFWRQSLVISKLPAETSATLGIDVAETMLDVTHSKLDGL